MSGLMVAAGIAAVLGYLVALLAVEGRLEEFRRPDAPPVPGWNWGRFAHLTDPANLRPGADRWVGWYKALWFAPVGVFVAAAVGLCRGAW